jgi:mono/diheme cytochrome c family protein
VTRNGAWAIASDPDRGSIYIVDLQKRALRSSLHLEEAREPGRAAEDNQGRIHVVLRDAGKVASFNPQTPETVAFRHACAAPRGIAYEAAEDALVVACAGGELVSLGAAGGAAILRATLDADLRDIVVLKERILVSRFRSSEVLTLTKNFNLVKRAMPAPLGGAKMSATTAWRLAGLPDEDSAILLHQRALAEPLAGAIDGSTVTETTAPDPKAVPYYGASPTTTTTTCSGGVVHSAASFVGDRLAALPIQDAVLAVDIAVAPNRQTAALAVPANAFISGMPTILMPLLGRDGQLEINAAETCVSPAGLVVPGEPIAVAFTPANQLLIQTREPASLRSTDNDFVIGLSTDSRADTGHDLFHANSGRGVACASCHAEGGDDGHTWLFPNGPRRTQPLRGGISETKPFHWNGDEKDVATVMRDTFEKRMAGPRLARSQLLAVTLWLDTIPSIRSTSSIDVAQGEALFAARCEACHSGVSLTNNAMVGAFNVPGLRNVSFRAPYLHDGSAPTLRDALEHAGSLEPYEVSYLVDFLKTL